MTNKLVIYARNGHLCNKLILLFALTLTCFMADIQIVLKSS